MSQLTKVCVFFPSSSLTVVHEGEPMLGRNSGRLVISISSFGSSLPLSCSSLPLPFFGEDSKGLSQEVMLTLAVLVNVVAIEHSIFVERKWPRTCVK